MRECAFTETKSPGAALHVRTSRPKMDQNRLTPVKGSAWTAIAVLGFALVGVLKRPAGAVQTTGGLAAAAHRPGNDAGGSTSRPGASDEPTQHPPGVMGVGRAVFDRFGRDNISLVAAGVAFYVMLSIFPALAAMVSLYALVGNPGRRRQSHQRLRQSPAARSPEAHHGWSPQLRQDRGSRPSRPRSSQAYCWLYGAPGPAFPPS